MRRGTHSTMLATAFAAMPAIAFFCIKADIFTSANRATANSISALTRTTTAHW